MGKLSLITLYENDLESFAFSIDASELVHSRIGLSLRPHPYDALAGIQRSFFYSSKAISILAHIELSKYLQNLLFFRLLKEESLSLLESRRAVDDPMHFSYFSKQEIELWHIIDLRQDILIFFADRFAGKRAEIIFIMIFSDSPIMRVSILILAMIFLLCHS